MIVDYYRGRRLARGDAEMFGITVGSPVAKVAVRHHRSTVAVVVGRIVVTGDEVCVVPCVGVEHRAVELLLGAAEQVWRFGRGPGDEGWYRGGDGGWETVVEVRLSR